MIGGAIVSGIAGSLGSNIVDRMTGHQKPTPDMDAPSVNSSMNGTDNSSGDKADVQVSGSQSGQYVKEFMDSAFSKGIQSVLNPSVGAGQLGRDQRSFMDNAFPDLNQWEQAGASAAGASVENAKQNNAKEMQNAQLKSQERVAKYQADSTANASRDVATLNNQTSRENVQDQVYAQNQRLDSEVAYNMAREASATLGLQLTEKQIKHFAQSTVGKTAQDAIGMLEQLLKASNINYKPGQVADHFFGGDKPKTDGVQGSMNPSQGGLNAPRSGLKPYVSPHKSVNEQHLYRR